MSLFTALHQNGLCLRKRLATLGGLDEPAVGGGRRSSHSSQTQTLTLTLTLTRSFFFASLWWNPVTACGLLVPLWTVGPESRSFLEGKDVSVPSGRVTDNDLSGVLALLSHGLTIIRTHLLLLCQYVKT